MKKDAICRQDEVVFFMAIIVYYLSVLINLTFLKVKFGQVYTMCEYLKKLSFILLAVSLFFQIIREKQFYIGGFMLFLSIITAITSGENIIIWGVMAIIAGNCTTSRKIIKTILLTQIFVFLLTILLCGVGIIDDYISDPDTRRRHSLGFTWTTTSMVLVMFMVMEYCFLRGKKIKLFEICLLEIAITILFVLTNTRMCYVITSCMLFAIALQRMLKIKVVLSKNERRIDRRLALVVPWVIFTIVLIISITYASTPIWKKIDDFMSSRLSLANNGINTYGIHLLGNPIKWIGFGYGGLDGTYNYVDSSYIQSLLSYGVLFMIMILSVYSCIYLHARKNGYAIIIMSLLLISITEPRLWNLTFNPLPFLLIDAGKDRNSFSTQEVVSNV